MSRRDEILKLLDARQSAANCSGMASLLDEAFNAIHDQGNSEAVRDLSLLFYLQNIESIEMASFRHSKWRLSGSTTRKSTTC